MEDVVLNSGLVTDKTLLFPTSQHDQGDKPRSDWLCGDRAGLVVLAGSRGSQSHTSHLPHTPASLLPLSSRGISTAAFDYIFHIIASRKYFSVNIHLVLGL